MTLTDLLGELAEDRPATAADLADRAWARGRRSRTRRRVGGWAAAAAVLTGLALLAPSAPVPTPSGFARTETTVGGYPERIGRQWGVRELPDRPGPLAALLQTAEGSGTKDFALRWYAVRSDGHRWRLPGVSGAVDAWPTLSPDGRRVGYLETKSGPYVVRDLVTGRRLALADISENRVPARTRWQLATQAPSFWSPSGQRLRLPTFPDPLVVDVATGRRWKVASSAGRAGFLDDERLVNLAPGGPGKDLRVVTTDLSGRRVADVGLRDTDGVRTFSQWSAAAGAGGALAFVEERAVSRFFLAGGDRFQGGPVPVLPASTCAASWGSGGQLVVSQQEGDALQAVSVEFGRPVTRTVVAPSVRGQCLVWAADALDRPGQGGGLFGTRDDAALEWWREVLLVTALGAGLLGALRWLRRRGADRD